MGGVAIIDYGLCNLDSVRRACEELGATPHVVPDGDRLGHPDRIVLPGVGAFPDAMANLVERGLDAALKDQVVNNGIPLLGICLGMQLLASSSTEGGTTGGLGWIPGEVRRLVPTVGDPRVPHVGWNTVHPVGPSPLFAGVEGETDFYFVHSFHFVPDADGDIAATTPYADGLVSSVAHDHVFGVQFHPEKSQRAGFRVLANFLEV